MTKQQVVELKAIKNAATEANLRSCLMELRFWRRFNDELSLQAIKVYERRCRRIRGH